MIIIISSFLATIGLLLFVINWIFAKKEAKFSGEFTNKFKNFERLKNFIITYLIVYIPAFLLTSSLKLPDPNNFNLLFLYFTLDFFILNQMLNLNSLLHFDIKEILPSLFSIIFIYYTYNQKFDILKKILLILAFVFMLCISIFDSIDCVILVLFLFFCTVDVVFRKRLLFDKNNNKLTFKQIISRNVVKFLCLYVVIIPAIYYINTKEILWDKITDTHYVSPLEE